MYEEDNPFSSSNEPQKGSGGPGLSANSNRPASPPRSIEPSWLKGPSSKTPPPVQGGGTGATTASSAPTPPPVQPQPPSGQTPQLVMYMRMANFALCVLMCVTAIWTVALPGSVSPAAWVLSFYVLAFSCLLCCFEFNLRQIAKHIADNFGFLYDMKTRAIFLVFVGVLCLSLGIIGKVAGACMIANAIFNSIVLCKHPEYQTYRPRTAQEEAAAYLQRNPRVAGQVISQGSSWI